VQLRHVEAGALTALDRLDEIRDHRLHVGARHGARHLAVRIVGQRRSRDNRPGALLERLVHAFPHQLGRALAARMAELERELRRRIGVHEVDDALPGGFLCVGVDAGAAGGDARV
jgi:hypothetical protein